MTILFPSNLGLKSLTAKKSEWFFSDDVLPNASIFDMTIRCGGSVVSAPIEKGSFVSYNKTNEPLEINATLAYEGTSTYLQSCIEQVKKLKESVALFSIITPNYEYKNMNLESFDYAQKREDGLGALYIKATFREIKEIPIIYGDGTNISQEQTKDISATSAVEGGLKQTKQPSALESFARGQIENSLNSIKDHVQFEAYNYLIKNNLYGYVDNITTETQSISE